MDEGADPNTGLRKQEFGFFRRKCVFQENYSLEDSGEKMQIQKKENLHVIICWIDVNCVL